MIKPLYIGIICLAMVFINGCSTLSTTTDKPAATDDSSAISTGLTKQLADKLGVTNQQAVGGAGAVLGYAQSKLSPDDFSKVTKAAPEIPDLIGAAPKQNQLSGQVASLSGDNNSIAGLGALTSSFSKLGLSPDMVTKYVPVILNYVKSIGGDSTKGILEGVLK